MWCTVREATSNTLRSARFASQVLGGRAGGSKDPLRVASGPGHDERRAGGRLRMKALKAWLNSSFAESIYAIGRLMVIALTMAGWPDLATL